jgi:RNA polymerase-binding transcription factor DksA
MIQGSPQYEQLLQRLEAGYEFHTEQLARLATLPDTDAAEAFTDASLMATSRQALADIAGALRDMAEGRYGRCRGCDELIPFERLEARPNARYCASCQVERHRLRMSG